MKVNRLAVCQPCHNILSSVVVDFNISICNFLGDASTARAAGVSGSARGLLGVAAGLLALLDSARFGSFAARALPP